MVEDGNLIKVCCVVQKFVCVGCKVTIWNPSVLIFCDRVEMKNQEFNSLVGFKYMTWGAILSP